MWPNMFFVFVRFACQSLVSAQFTPDFLLSLIISCWCGPPSFCCQPRLSSRQACLRFACSTASRRHLCLQDKGSSVVPDVPLPCKLKHCCGSDSTMLKQSKPPHPHHLKLIKHKSGQPRRWNPKLILTLRESAVNLLFSFCTPPSLYIPPLSLQSLSSNFIRFKIENVAG